MSVQSLPYNSTMQLTPHINAQELRCKCGGKHDILYDMDLLNKVEKLAAILGVDMITITSGYRCPTHDKKVGGNGRGQHTTGRAMDVKFCKNGKFISTKIISCVAQDIGFNGIANINASYTSIHLDNRKAGKYYGNEQVNLRSVTADFYAYYRLSKQNVDKYKASSFTPVWTYKYSTDILELQKILIAKGHKIVADGKAGDKTLEAVKRYTIARKDKGQLTYWVKKRLRSLRCPVGEDGDVIDIVCVAGIKLFETMNGLLVDGAIKDDDWYYLLK